MAYLSPIGNEMQADANGDPLNAGTITTYLAGTTTPAATYTSSTGLTLQANPIVLNTLGLPANPIWLGAGVAMKFVIADSNGVVLRTVDNILGVNDPVGVTAQDQWVTLASTPTYISATSFSVPGDQTPTLHAGRRLKTTNSGGVVYSVITASSFGAGVTTVTVSNAASVLDAGLSLVSYGILTYTNSSVPLQTGELINVQTFAANGTFAPTFGASTWVIELFGAGGAGGGAALTGVGQLAAGSGGSAGGYCKHRATGGVSGAAITIGAAGVGSAGAAGGNGGTTSFGAICSATGGAGGNAGSAVAAGTITFASAGAAGLGVGGNLINASGSPGAASLYGTAVVLSGAGGANQLGGGGASVSNAVGTAAPTAGAGGSGAASNASTAARAGGNGGNGYCIVWEYA